MCSSTKQIRGSDTRRSGGRCQVVMRLDPLARSTRYLQQAPLSLAARRRVPLTRGLPGYTTCVSRHIRSGDRFRCPYEPTTYPRAAERQTEIHDVSSAPGKSTRNTAPRGSFRLGTRGLGTRGVGDLAQAEGKRGDRRRLTFRRRKDRKLRSPGACKAIADLHIRQLRILVVIGIAGHCFTQHLFAVIAASANLSDPATASGSRSDLS